MKTIVRRHGDVLIKTKEGFKVPSDTKMEPAKLIHSGQNHDHYISSGKAYVGGSNGMKILTVLEDSEISHGRGQSSEHATKIIPKGDYWIEIQTERDHLKKISRKVID